MKARAKEEMVYNESTFSISEQFSKAKELCKCPFACESIEYLPTVSYSPYPNDIDARKEATDMLVKEGKNVTEEGIRNKTLEFRWEPIAMTSPWPSDHGTSTFDKVGLSGILETKEGHDWGGGVCLSELCRGTAMVAYTKPQQRKKEESEQLRGKRDKIKFIDLGFEKWQVVRFRKARGRQDVS